MLYFLLKCWQHWTTKSPFHGSTVPKWKLGTILMLTLCLGMSLRELIVLSQDQSNLLLQDNGKFSLPTTFEGMPNNEQPSIFEATNRSILLVHVGKAGGSTIRRVAQVICKAVRDPINPKRPPLQRSCTGNNSRYQLTVPRTGKLIQDVFHMWAYNETFFPLVTTYLVTIRNPIDRIISAFRYSHPKNCPMHLLEEKGLQLPGGCQLYKNKKIYTPETAAYLLFHTCFPSAAMEDFAQSIMSPWVSGAHFEANLTVPQQWTCRGVALSVVRGLSEHNQGGSPHMHFNYRYYGEKTFLQYPDKEVLAVRTEHEWEDLFHLDRWLGGNGIRKDTLYEVTHGSTDYVPSPLSPQSYQKLCCALVEEIEIFFLILDKALNLNATQKHESRQEVYRTCSIDGRQNSTLPSWDEWKVACHQILQEDAKVLANKTNMHHLGMNGKWPVTRFSRKMPRF